MKLLCNTVKSVNHYTVILCLCKGGLEMVSGVPPPWKAGVKTLGSPSSRDDTGDDEDEGLKEFTVGVAEVTCSVTFPPHNPSGPN